MSFPKSGRTWLYVMFTELGWRVKASHAKSGHRKANLIEELPRPDTVVGRVIFLHRDPRATVVSGFYQATRRLSPPYEGSISDFIRDPRHGIEKVLRFNAMWLGHRPDALVVRYEDFHADPASELRRVSSFLGRHTDEQAIERAVAAGRFETMRAKEAAGAYRNARLRPGNSADLSSYKTRRGTTDSWREELSSADIAYCESVLRAGITIAP